MIDSITKGRLEVLAYGQGRPYIIVPESQLKRLCALLDKHRIRYEVDEDMMSVDDEPYVTFVTLARGTDPAEVQRLLDGVS